MSHFSGERSTRSLFSVFSELVSERADSLAAADLEPRRLRGLAAAAAIVATTEGGFVRNARNR